MTANFDEPSNEATQDRLGSATDGDLWRAAEAIVDAAMTIHRSKGVAVTSESREALVKAVFQDPGLTAFLLSVPATVEKH